MIKSSFIVFVFFISLFASDISSDLIKIHARIYPQIPLFNEYIQKNNSSIVIAALYGNNSSKRIADEFKKSVEEYYGTNIGGKKLVVNVVFCEEAVKKQADITAMYIIDCDRAILKNLTQSITFTAYRNFFDENYAIFYIDITNQTKILLNKKVLLNSGFSFSTSFLKITTAVNND